MRILLQAVGVFWAVLGLANFIFGLDGMSLDSIGNVYTGDADRIASSLIFSFMLFVLPGLVLLGLGSMIKPASKSE